jgi:glycosyltransferase-like protein
MLMLSVGIFTYSTKPRGSVVHAACLAEALADEGAWVTLYALSKRGEPFYRPLRVPVALIPAGDAPSDSDALVRQRIAEFQEGFRSLGMLHDIYHAEDCLAASALVTSERPKIFPVVRTVHHVEHFENAYLAECQRRSILSSRLVLSVSAFTAHEVEAHFGRKSQVIYNGVDSDRFGRALSEETAWHLERRFGFGRKDRVILSVGGVEERKNIHRALEAVALAHARHPELCWLVVGGASFWDHSAERRRFDARLSELPVALQERVRIVGPVDEATLTALQKRADVMLTPSLHEGWGLAALEGLAAGSAVIASNREPFTEFLDAETARLVDPESVHAIAEALVALLDDPAARRALGRAGVERARQFDWRRTAACHLVAYRALVTSLRAADSTALRTGSVSDA